MHARLLYLYLFIILLTPAHTLAQARPSSTGETSATESAIAGRWTYRSFVNTPALVGGEADRALAILFGEGVFIFEPPSAGVVKGELSLGPGFVLDLQGSVRAETADSPLTVALIGAGRIDSRTAGWEYRYHGYLAHHWPEGVDQVPAIVGSIVRAKPHDGAPAGDTASFIAVRQR